jgi:hypothetical protein
MAKTIGNFTLPQNGAVHKTSQLENDSRFSSIYEYILDSSTLNGSASLEISDLPVNTVITKIEMYVLEGITKSISGATTMSIVGTNTSSSLSGTLMNTKCNDPDNVGLYCTDCYFVVKSTKDTVSVNHNASTCTGGSIILRLTTYQSPYEYTPLSTADGLSYTMSDGDTLSIIN